MKEQNETKCSFGMGGADQARKLIVGEISDSRGAREERFGARSGRRRAKKPVAAPTALCLNAPAVSTTRRRLTAACQPDSHHMMTFRHNHKPAHNRMSNRIRRPNRVVAVGQLRQPHRNRTRARAQRDHHQCEPKQTPRLRLSLSRTLSFSSLSLGRARRLRRCPLAALNQRNQPPHRWFSFRSKNQNRQRPPESLAIARRRPQALFVRSQTGVRPKSQQTHTSPTGAYYETVLRRRRRPPGRSTPPTTSARSRKEHG